MVNTIKTKEQPATELEVSKTKRKQMETALRENEEGYGRLFELFPVGVIILDIKGVIIYCNSAVYEKGGYPKGEFIGKHFSKISSVGVNDISKYIRVFNSIVRGKTPEPFEATYQRKDGTTGWTELNVGLLKIGGKRRILVIQHDITERKLAEEALRESEEKFSKAFRSSPDAIAITTLKDGKFIEVNDSYSRITGYTRKEVIGHSTAEFGTWAKAEERDRILRMLKEQGRVINEEVHLYRKSGELCTWLFSAEEINIGGEPCMISVATDITERKQAEEKLKQALANLKHSNTQLAATNKELEAFSYSVSHDLRAPLRTIDGFSQALLEDYVDKLNEQGQDYLSRLRRASQKMGELIDGLLKLSRLTRSDMHKEKIDLSALAEEITTRLQETQPERQAEFVISQRLNANGDRQLLRVLLENLLDNAWKFTSKCPQARIEFGATQNGGKKAYFVRDNGAGFDMTYADKLFSAFQRLHETTLFPGTGIGLATVQRIINRHGGSVWAEGAVGKGATFYFTLN